MRNEPQNSAEKDPGQFAIALGRAMQNYGLVEHITNDIIAFIVKEATLHRHLAKQGIINRLEILFELLDANASTPKPPQTPLNELKQAAIVAFRNRNKIAHNPLFVKMETYTKDGATQSRQITLGINVVRHHENKSNEWIDYEKLQRYLIESNELVANFTNLQNSLHKPLKET